MYAVLVVFSPVLRVSNQMTMAPFTMDAPGGINSVLTSLMKPVLPVIFFMQFMYLYRCGLLLGFCFISVVLRWQTAAIPV